MRYTVPIGPEALSHEGRARSSSRDWSNLPVPALSSAPMPPLPLAAPLATLALCIPAVSAQEFGAWHAIGPFPHPQGSTQMEPPQPVERLLKSFASGKELPDFAEPVKTKEATLRWVELQPGVPRGLELDAGLIDFNQVLAPANAPAGWSTRTVAYLYRRIDCASDTELAVQVGSDDGLRLWLGGELLIDRGVARALTIEDHQIVLRLRAGANHLFAKVVNDGGVWSFRMSPWKRIEQAAIDKAIDRGVEYLAGAQLLDGTWGSHPEYGTGHTAFTVYTLLESGVAPEDPTIQLALGALEALPSDHTYAASCLVLALSAMHDERFRPRIEAAVQDLVDWQSGQDLFSYPILPGYPGTLPPDLSNTLYAALAFRAAEQNGLQVPDKIWNDLAEGTLRCLTKELLLGANATGKAGKRAAGFSYRVGTNEPTGSMTTAGLSVLAVAQEGTDGKLPPALVQRARGATELGLAWLDRNMYWDGNPGQGNAHHYFWIYGVERAGTLLGLEVLGGVDWYWSGAAYLVRKQKDNGSWASVRDTDEPVDTLLALLFLERATVPIASGTREPERRNPRQPSTQVGGERGTEWEAGGGQDPLRIHARGESTTVLWTSGLRDDLRDALTGPKGIEVVELEFLGDCAEDDEDESGLGAVPGRLVAPDELSRLEFVHVFARPGTWTVRARLHVLVQGTQPRVVETPRVALQVRNVFDRKRLEYVGDPDRSLLRGTGPKIEASTSAARGKEAVDGNYATAWECDAKDAKPWIRLTPVRPIQAERLALAQALNRPRDAAKPRAREVEVVLNGETKLRLVLGPDNRLKSTLALPPRTPVRTLELRILSLHDGKLGEAAAGFSEIELFGAR